MRRLVLLTALAAVSCAHTPASANAPGARAEAREPGRIGPCFELWHHEICLNVEWRRL